MRRVVALALPWLLTAVLAQGGVVSGTVSGENLSGALVIACLVVNDDCDEARSTAARVGANGGYRLENLGAGPYLILAWRDVNGNGQFDAGDEGAIYSSDGKAPTPLRPPGQRIDLRLRPYNGTDASLLAPPRGGGPGGLVGTWVSTGSNEVLSYTLKADGTYESGSYFKLSILGGCERNGVTVTSYVSLYTTGTYRVQGNQLLLTPRSGSYTSDRACVYKKEGPTPEQMKPYSLTWRAGDLGGQPVLYLVSASGKEEVYRLDEKK